MSTLRELPKQQWKRYFESVSGVLTGTRAEIEVASLEVGDQIAAQWLPLLGLTYDSRDDLIDVSLTGLNHLIRQPAQIEVTEDDAGTIRSIAVRTADGTLQVLRLKDPLRLPAAV
jgi:hypothetical protein